MPRLDCHPRTSRLAGATVGFGRNRGNFLSGRIVRAISRCDFAAPSGDFGIPRDNFAPARNSSDTNRSCFALRSPLSQATNAPGAGRGNSPVCELIYDASGNMTQRRIAWFYSSPSNFEYDDVNRVTMFEDGNSSGMYARSHYQYDTVGREAAVWRDEDGSKGDGFSYSADNQLTAARYKGDWAWAGPPNNPARSVDYTYNLDMLNRQSVTDNGAVTSYAAPSGVNQYPSVGNQNLSYNDNRLNLTGYNGATFSYNAQNQLMSASNGGTSAQFVYDGLGRCVKRTISGVTRFITYDDWNPIWEWDASGNGVDANIYGARADEIIGRWDSSYGFQFYKQDKQGNVTQVLDQNGGIVEKYRYDAFGKPTISDWNDNGRSSSIIGNRFMYTGREYIQELGIYDYRHRMYQPDLGRFLQMDPMGLQTEREKLSAGQKALFSPSGVAPEAFTSSEMNLFRYCDDDPVDRSDPLGLWSPDAHDFMLEHAYENSLSQHDIAVMQRESRELDKKTGIPARDAYIHAMRRAGEAPDHARAMTNRFIGEQIAAAKQAAAHHDREAALRHLADAAHAKMDSSSPAHTKPNGEPRLWGIENAVNFPKHSFDDTYGNERTRDITPAILDRSDRDLRALYRKVF
jgi:RHS repeat-associated protein